MTPRELAAGLVFNFRESEWPLTIECNFCDVLFHEEDGPEYGWLEEAAKHIVTKHLRVAKAEAKR